MFCISRKNDVNRRTACGEALKHYVKWHAQGTPKRSRCLGWDEGGDRKGRS